jgi:hypothetical protein
MNPRERRKEKTPEVSTPYETFWYPTPLFCYILIHLNMANSSMPTAEATMLSQLWERHTLAVCVRVSVRCYFHCTNLTRIKWLSKENNKARNITNTFWVSLVYKWLRAILAYQSFRLNSFCKTCESTHISLSDPTVHELTSGITNQSNSYKS